MQDISYDGKIFILIQHLQMSANNCRFCI